LLSQLDVLQQAFSAAQQLEEASPAPLAETSPTNSEASDFWQQLGAPSLVATKLAWLWQHSLFDSQTWAGQLPQSLPQPDFSAQAAATKVSPAQVSPAQVSPAQQLVVAANMLAARSEPPQQLPASSEASSETAAAAVAALSSDQSRYRRAANAKPIKATLMTAALKITL
jgi:hypothetical protein